MSNSWREIAEVNELDCTLKRVEIICVLDHVPVPGNDFMPYGWCGDCETCRSIVCPDVCEACSYTEKYDFRQPVYWPCHIEQGRINAETRAAHEAELRARRQERLDRANYDR